MIDPVKDLVSAAMGVGVMKALVEVTDFCGNCKACRAMDSLSDDLEPDVEEFMRVRSDLVDDVRAAGSTGECVA